MNKNIEEILGYFNPEKALDVMVREKCKNFCLYRCEKCDNCLLAVHNFNNCATSLCHLCELQFDNPEPRNVLKHRMVCLNAGQISCSCVACVNFGRIYPISTKGSNINYCEKCYALFGNVNCLQKMVTIFNVVPVRKCFANVILIWRLIRRIIV